MLFLEEDKMTLTTEEYSSPPANAAKGFFKRSYSIEVWLVIVNGG